MDVDAIPPGTDFVDHLDQQVAKCRAFLSVIGPGWLGDLNRLHDEADFIRVEIVSALTRPEIPIIPVLIDDAKMPAAEELPEPMRKFVRRAGIVLPHDHFSAVVDGRLTSVLRDAMAQAEGEPSSHETNTAATESRETVSSNGRTHGDSAAGRVVAPKAVTESSVSDRGPETSTIGKSFANARLRRSAYGIGAVLGAAAVAAGLFYGLALDPATGLKSSATVDPVTTPAVKVKEFSDCIGCPTMVEIPAGQFRMGSPQDERGRVSAEGPQHVVNIKPFAIARTEVTYEQWAACVKGGGCTSKPDPDDRNWGRQKRPVVDISWHDAKEYIAWLNLQVAGSNPYYLPSEAEWEYAARGGTSEYQAYPWGRQWDGSKAASGLGQTRPVASYPANDFGLFDMIGNVWEWTQDCWRDSYSGAPDDGSARESSDGGVCNDRVVRGGSSADRPEKLRSAHRLKMGSNTTIHRIGFRPARRIDQ